MQTHKYEKNYKKKKITQIPTLNLLINVFYTSVLPPLQTESRLYNH